MLEPLVLRSPTLELAGLRHGFTTRIGGHSKGTFGGLNLSPKWPEEADNVAANRRLLARHEGFGPDRLFLATQVHGTEGVRVTSQSPDQVSSVKADYLYSDLPGVTLGVITADCVGLLLADPDAPNVAAVHAGWRGMVAGVIEAAVSSLGDLGSCPDRLRAGLGPCIGPCCFEVGQEVADAFSSRFGASAGVVLTADLSGPRQPGPGEAARKPVSPSEPRPHVDLWRGARVALERAGLDPAAISDPPGCTMCDQERFFSYRRDGARIGQQLSFVGRT